MYITKKTYLSLFRLRGLALAFVGLCWPVLAVAGCCGPSWACIGLSWLLWAFVNLRWPSLAIVGHRWLLWPFVGFVVIKE